MSIQIVTHCYAARMPQYAVDLKYQLSSLILYEPIVPVTVTVCYSFHDERVIKTLRDYRPYFSNSSVTLDVRGMSGPELYRRSIGRNIAAMSSKADLVWFADADYVFHEGCLDQLWQINEDFGEEKPTLMFPREVNFHESHAAGDALITKENLDTSRLLEIDCSEFRKERYSRAIGGVQIAQGEHVRTHGYLNSNQKYQTPVVKGKIFHTTEDSAFRKQCELFGNGSKGIDLSNLYRIRHYLNAYQEERQKA